eukprot:scaffold6734_cov23-Tisochrysis_lutea.AAC.4
MSLGAREVRAWPWEPWGTSRAASSGPFYEAHVSSRGLPGIFRFFFQASASTIQYELSSLLELFSTFLAPPSQSFSVAAGCCEASASPSPSRSRADGGCGGGTRRR